MTREEAKGFIQGKLDCMNMCDVFECKGTDECDSCNYCYSQGNFGEQKKAFEMAIEVLGNDTNVGSKWIPCSERLPEERESMFKKFKGTSKWCEAMFKGISDDVNVTVEFEDGTRTTKVSHTLDGKWKCEKDYGIKMKVIAWQPLPEPYKEGET